MKEIKTILLVSPFADLSDDIIMNNYISMQKAINNRWNSDNVETVIMPLTITRNENEITNIGRNLIKLAKCNTVIFTNDYKKYRESMAIFEVAQLYLIDSYYMGNKGDLKEVLWD